MESAAVDRRGRIFTTFTEIPGRVIVFDGQGRFVRELHLPDSTMAEATFLSLSTQATDSIYVVDGQHGLFAVYGPDLRPARTARITTGVVRGIVPQKNGTYFLSADIRRPETVGLPLHIMRQDGSVQSSFGAPDTAFIAVGSGNDAHLVAVTPDDGVWTIPERTLLLQRWEGPAVREQLGFEGRAPESWRFTPRTVGGMRLTPVVRDLRADACGRLWVVSRVPSDVSWKVAGFDSLQVGPVGQWRYRLRYPDRLAVAAIDLIEPRAGRYVASFRLPLSVEWMPSDTTLLTTSRDDDETTHTTLLRLHIQPSMRCSGAAAATPH